MANGSNSSNMADVSSSSNNNAFKLEWDQEFKCYRIDGMLAPRPVSWHQPVPLVAGPPPSSAHSPHQEQAQSVSRRRQRRDMPMAVIDEVISLTFRLLKCQNEDQGYILEMTEVENMCVYYYVLYPVEGKVHLKVKEFQLKERIIKEVTEDVEPPTNSKYKLSLQQRIQGKWHVEVGILSPLKLTGYIGFGDYFSANDVSI